MPQGGDLAVIDRFYKGRHQRQRGEGRHLKMETLLDVKLQAVYVVLEMMHHDTSFLTGGALQRET